MSSSHAIRRLCLASGLLALTVACAAVDCGADDPDRKLQDAIRDGDTEEAARQLRAGAHADGAGAWSVSPRSLVQGEPGDWLGSYLKYHQLLWIRFYASDPQLCAQDDRAPATEPREIAKQLGELAERTALSFEGVTPLHAAAFFCRTEIARLLLDAGASVDARDGAGLAPLHWVSCGEVAQLLLTRRADAMAASATGLTPLHTAIDVDVVRALLEHGARLDARDRCGNTPLHIASAMGLRFDGPRASLAADDQPMPTWARMLLALVDRTSEVVDLLARRFDVVGAIEEAGAPPNATNAVGHTPGDVFATASSGGDD